MSMQWVRRAVEALVLAIVVLLAACEGKGPPRGAPPGASAAELRVVRRGVRVEADGRDAREVTGRERLATGDTLALEAGAVAWLRRDGGVTLLVRGPAKLRLESDRFTIDEGRVFAEVPPGSSDALEAVGRRLTLSAVRASLEVTSERLDAYVLEGEVRLGETAARTGERLTAARGDAAPAVRPELAWSDWTGGLATTDRSIEPAPYGVGTVSARTPGSQGDPFAPLTIQRLDVRVTIRGDLAVTEVDQTFFNPVSTTVEGLYRFRVPEGALLERFGVDRDGGILYGFVKEQAQAQAQYQANVYQGSTEDPALLVWTAPGEYEARLYPIGPGATRRVVVRYTEWLERTGERGERRAYVYPMAFEGAESAAPIVEDLSIEVDVAQASGEAPKANAKPRLAVRTAVSTTRVGDTVVARGHDVVPRSDFTLELFDEGRAELTAFRAAHRPDLAVLGDEEAKDARRLGAGEADYLIVPVRADDVRRAEPGLDLVVVIDTSAATDPATLRLARATTRALLAHLGARDRVLVLSGDDALRPVLAGAEALEAVDEKRAEALLDAVAELEAGGATDLGAMLALAGEKLDPRRQGAIVYVGDGNPTVGEVELGAIRTRLRKASRPSRTYGLGLGDGANLALLAGLSHGGFARRIVDERSAARAALSLLESAEHAAELGATIELGEGVERVVPSELGALVGGSTTLVVGRLRGEPPKTVELVSANGRTTRPLAVRAIDDAGDLRRRWAMGRLDELLAESAGRAALVDLGVRQGIVTPVTSIYVPTAREMTSRQRAQIERRGRVRTKLAQPTESKSDDDGLFDAKSEAAPSDNKEGGSGTRAKGEEGSMGNPNAKASGQRFGVAVETETARPRGMWGASIDDARGPSTGESKPAVPSGGGAPSPQSATAPAEAAAPRAAATAAPAAMDAPSSPPTSNEYGVAPASPAAPTNGPGLGDIGTIGHGSGTGTGQGFGSGGGRLGGSHRARDAGGGDGLALSGIGEGGGGRGDLAKSPAKGKRVPDAELERKASNDSTTPAETISEDGYFREREVRRGSHAVVVVIDHPGLRARQCSKAADLPLEQRRVVWRERLARTNAAVSAVERVVRIALGSCEAPTLRDRRSLALLALDTLPTVPGRVALYRAFTPDRALADALYRGLLARVTTAEQVRELHAALGLVLADPAEVEASIAKETSAAARVPILRRWVDRYPDDLPLALRLLDALEDASDAEGARRLARELRSRRDVDASVRTAVGELHLRLARTGDAESKARDEREAKRAFGEIVEFSPDDPAARRRLGDLYRAHGFYAEASRQFESLARLLPDDARVSLLQASAANGLGKLEEALAWVDKAGRAGASDATTGPSAIARGFATLYLAWGRKEARDAGRTDELTALSSRLDRLLNGEKRAGTIRVLLSWEHPDFHPVLWSNALGTWMPASDGDATLGLAHVDRSASPTAAVELRVDPTELDRAVRLGASARLTVVFDEGLETERIASQSITFERGRPRLAFKVAGGVIEPVSSPSEESR